MDWDKLRVFYTVADAGSFTHAGEVLNLSQSAVSRQISTLEESLDLPLFHRHARGLILTEQGEILHKAASDIFDKLSSIESQLSDSNELPEGPLKITVTDFIGSTWLVPRLKKLRKLYPDLQLTMLMHDRFLNLSMREADAAIRFKKPEQHDLVQRHLTSIRFHICGSLDYFKTYGYPKDVKDLKNHTLIGYPEGVPEPFNDPNWIFRIASVKPERHNNLLMMNSMYAIHRAVSSGAGIAALPDYLIHAEKNLEVILPNIQRDPVDMYFVYPEERRNSKRIAIFRDFLLDNLKNAPFEAD